MFRFGILSAEERNLVVASNPRPTELEGKVQGFAYEFVYDIQASQELLNDIYKSDVDYATIYDVPVQIIINDEVVKEDKAYLDVYYDGRGRLWGFLDLPQGTYRIKVIVPEEIRAYIKFCITVLVYGERPTTHSCYDTYDEAKKVSETVGGETITGRGRITEVTGEVEFDAGEITVGEWPAPLQPAPEPGGWSPGKIIREILKRIFG